MRPFGHLQFCHSGESRNLPQQCNDSQVSAFVEMAPMREGPMRPFVPNLPNYFTVFCQKARYLFVIIAAVTLIAFQTSGK